MIKLFGELYYIDFEELDDFLLLDNKKKEKIKTTRTTKRFDKSGELESTTVVEDEHIKHKEINGVKFEIIRGFIADISEEAEEGDYAIGSTNLDRTSVRFKLAFNTLVGYRILKTLD